MLSSDVLGPIVGIAEAILIVWLIYKYGIIGILQRIKRLNDWVVYGPPQKPAPEVKKADLRKTAMLETELYGEVMSESLKDMWRRTEVPAHGCEDYMTLAGKCTLCGKPHPRLPDPFRKV